MVTTTPAFGTVYKRPRNRGNESWDRVEDAAYEVINATHDGDRERLRQATNALLHAVNGISGVQAIRPPGVAPVVVTHAPGLSNRQMQVLIGISKGMTFSEIAEALGISAWTVSSFTRQLYERLGVHNRSGAVDTAHRLGILPL